MFSRMLHKFNLSRGAQSCAKGCLAVVALSAVMAVVVKVHTDAPYGLQFGLDPETGAVALAGAAGGVVGVLLGRGWLGGLGVFGVARAFIGAIVIGLIAAAVAGAFIVPLAGAIYAPLFMVTACLAQPWIAALWFAGVFGAHSLMAVLQRERMNIVEPSGLSNWSRRNLYNR